MTWRSRSGWTCSSCAGKVHCADRCAGLCWAVPLCGPLCCCTVFNTVADPLLPLCCLGTVHACSTFTISEFGLTYKDSATKPAVPSACEHRPAHRNLAQQASGLHPVVVRYDPCIAVTAGLRRPGRFAKFLSSQPDLMKPEVGVEAGTVMVCIVCTQHAPNLYQGKKQPT